MVKVQEEYILDTGGRAPVNKTHQKTTQGFKVFVLKKKIVYSSLNVMSISQIICLNSLAQYEVNTALNGSDIGTRCS